MSKKILIVTFFVFFSSGLQNIYANEEGWDYLKQGGNFVFIRHAYAPGNGDPSNFEIEDCSTQRNLSNQGILQSIEIGKKFRNKLIPVNKVFSSQWCRCKDTALYAFDDYKELSSLNSTYSSKFKKNESQQILDLNNYIASISIDNGNIIFVTHYVIIGAMTKYYPNSGEIVITNKDLNILATIKNDY